MPAGETAPTSRWNFGHPFHVPVPERRSGGSSARAPTRETTETPAIPRRRTIAVATAAGAVLVAAWVLAVLVDVPVATPLAVAFLWLVGTAGAAWLLWHGYQRLLWRVSGRLAFSYFLIGVVPIPLVALLLGLVAYLVSGFFLGHLYRDALAELEREIEVAAAHGVSEPTDASRGIARATYRGGTKTGGDPRAPESWPDWLEAVGSPVLVTLPDGTLSLAAASSSGSGGARIAFYGRDLGEVLRDREGFWVESRMRDPESALGAQINFGETGFNVGATGLLDLTDEERAERAAYFAEHAPGETPGLRSRPLVQWLEPIDAVRSLGTGEPVESIAGMGLAASVVMLTEPLFAADAELSRSFWIAFLIVSFLLLAIYAVAELVAIAMIFGLSRAVTRLYTATADIAQGDFSTRIPVSRSDQVGALQRSFNSMAESLEDLVATSAQKELLDKELEIAREVQQSLIPQNLPRGERLEFSTLFEPSAAIGGDYFDVLRLSDRELGLVVADVSGHGLSTGLRMAMVKAAVQILVDENRGPEEILAALDKTVRSSAEGRFFVTATFARIDFVGGVVELVNAGHPPTYHVRGGLAEEIALPGSPLGGLGATHGHRSFDLEDGDLVVWLSDGLIEAVDGGGEPFGYERVVEALSGAPAGSAEELRDRLLERIAAHTGGRPADDDRTLVVMRYNTPASAV